MAISDVPKPATTYEFNIIGNRVFDPNTVNGCTVAAGCDRMIAGLVHVSQQDLNSGAGYINFIDYGTGELEVGGTLGQSGTGTRVAINDPANPGALDENGFGGSGRYGRPNSVDNRFQVDQDNPTIEAETGFPMCIPRVSPYPGAGIATSGVDPQCPESNRPRVTAGVLASGNVGVSPNPNTLKLDDVLRIFRMDNPAFIGANGVGALCTFNPCADPRVQAPFEIGDYVSYAGNLVNRSGTPTEDVAGSPTYILAHTIVDSLGIYTTTGVDPAYVTVEVTILGTGGLTVFGAGEAAVRTRFEGMSTDESRQVDLYGVDINPASGATTDREWGSVQPDAGPPTGAVRGRWRFRPPCTGVVNALPAGKNCSPPPAGQFIPPTREVRAVIHGLSQFLPGTIIPNPASQVPVAAVQACTYVGGTKTNPTACTTANGLFYGQYHAPIGEYIFPENVPGSAVPENNFNSIPFLAYGGYATVDGVQVGVLNPWPSNVAPPAALCGTATINGGPYSMSAGSSIPLSGSIAAGATTPVAMQWTLGALPGGNELSGLLTGSNTTTPSVSAALPVGTYNLTFSTDNIVCNSVASTTITVTPAAVPPTIKPIQAQTVTAGNNVILTALLGVAGTATFAWVQTSGPAGPVPPNPGVGGVPSPAAGSLTARSDFTFNAATAGVYTFNVTATAAGLTSPAVSVTVTATQATATTITFGGTLEYRIGKQRLVMTATSPLGNAVASMKLMPYLTESGTIFDPTTLGAGLSISLITPGSWTITLVGAPKPACNLGGAYATPCQQTPITVKAYNAANVLIDSSVATQLQKIRQ
jgi:hypothetical protein